MSEEKTEYNTVNHPTYYNQIPGIECIDVVKYFDFVLGNIIKYVWRAGLKQSTNKLEDLEKAKWYLECEIKQETAKLKWKSGLFREFYHVGCLNNVTDKYNNAYCNRCDRYVKEHECKLRDNTND